MDGDNHGSTNEDQKHIFIDNSRDLQCQRETLMHELIHAVSVDCPSFRLEYDKADEREEDIVRFISPKLMQAFCDNRWLKQFLFEEDK